MLATLATLPRVDEPDALIAPYKRLGPDARGARDAPDAPVFCMATCREIDFHSGGGIHLPPPRCLRLDVLRVALRPLRLEVARLDAFAILL